MFRTYLTFGDIACKLEMLRIECTRCARKGRYSVAKLIAQHGRRGNMRVPHWQASKRLDPMVCSSATTRYCFLRGAGLLRLQEIERCRRSTGNENTLMLVA